MTIGSRAQVFHSTKDKTAGGLKKSDLKLNKNGEIVSKKNSARAKKTEPVQLKLWRDSVKKVSGEPKYDGKFTLLKKGTPFYKDVKALYKTKLEKL